MTLITCSSRNEGDSPISSSVSGAFGMVTAVSVAGSASDAAAGCCCGSNSCLGRGGHTAGDSTCVLPLSNWPSSIGSPFVYVLNTDATALAHVTVKRPRETNWGARRRPSRGNFRLSLAAAASRPAVVAAVASAAACHDPAAVAARRRVRLRSVAVRGAVPGRSRLAVFRGHHLRLHCRREDSELLFLLLAQELRRHPAEDVIRDRLRHRYLAVLGAAG